MPKFRLNELPAIGLYQRVSRGILHVYSAKQMTRQEFDWLLRIDKLRFSTILNSAAEGRVVMVFKMRDFILGMGKTFALEAMQISDKFSLEIGETLFDRGDPACHFYVLVRGEVKLRLGKAGPVVYTVRGPGEVIGWSSLVGRDVYSASAQCIEAAQLLKFNRDRFLELLHNYPSNEALVFKRLAEMLGNRLLELYPSIT
jgi:CRP-like cAMP-binding protein